MYCVRECQRCHGGTAPTPASAGSGPTMPLFLPAFATRDNFVEDNLGHEAKLTMNPDIVASVVVAVSTWRSLCEKLIEELLARCEAFYEPAYGKTEKDIRGEIALWHLNVNETELLEQLKTDRVVVCLNLLRASGDAEGMHELDRLEKHMETLTVHRERAVVADKHLSLFSPYIACLDAVAARDKPLSEVLDLLEPLFSTLRMAWSCDALYPSDSVGTRRYWEMLGSILRIVAGCVRCHLHYIPTKIGNAYTNTDKARPSEAATEHRAQKTVLLNVLDVTTSVKETYFKTRVYLEESMGRAWDFSTKWEEVMFEDLDFLYEKGMEVLSCLDACYNHYLVQIDMKKKNAEDESVNYNTALLTATLNDITEALNDLPFDLTKKQNYSQWDEAFAGFRSKSAHLKQLEETGGVHTHASMAPQEARIRDNFPEEAVEGFTSVGLHGGKALTEPSPTLFLVTTFNPPEVFIYGPIREGTIDVLNFNIPSAFSTATSKVNFGKTVPPLFQKKGVKDEAANYTGADIDLGTTYWHLAAHSQFCDELGQSLLTCVILDTLEKEARWVLRDTNATYLPLSGDAGQRVYYKFFFQKRERKIGA